MTKSWQIHFTSQKPSHLFLNIARDPLGVNSEVTKTSLKNQIIRDSIIRSYLRRGAREMWTHARITIGDEDSAWASSDAPCHFDSFQQEMPNTGLQCDSCVKKLSALILKSLSIYSSGLNLLKTHRAFVRVQEVYTLHKIQFLPKSSHFFL